MNALSDKRPTLLIAEDDAEIRHLLRERLEGAGYETRLARNGAEAITALHRAAFAGLLLDINMPESDGFAVLQAKAQIRNFPPVLMLTARHATSDVRRALALGASDYLTKPFSEAQLIARVRRLTRPPKPPSGEELLL